VIIYGAAQISRKEIFLREFSILCQKVKGPTLFGGDFNIIRKSCEKSNGGSLAEVLFSMQLLSIIISWNYT
jgi:hypothetical protein